MRAKVAGTAARPRLSVYRSNRDMSAQLIDDTRGVTLASANSVAVEKTIAKAARITKTDSARAIGMAIAKAGKTKGISNVVFDRGGYRYIGRVQALAEGAREGGLVF